jgi:hypothetical protein
MISLCISFFGCLHESSNVASNRASNASYEQQKWWDVEWLWG